MSLRAVGYGIGAGTLLGAFAALLLAVVSDRAPVSEGILRLALTVGSLVACVGAGWVAGRTAESGGGVHGALAGLGLAAGGSALAAATGLAAGPLPISLALGVVLGAAGGVWAAMQ